MRISDWSSDVCSSDLAAEAILPRAQRRKHGELVLKWLAGVLLGRAAHRSDGAAQKRVVASLKRDRRRQAWRVIRTQVADFGNAGLQGGIAGFERARECEIRRRSEAGRVGKEWVSTCRSRWGPCH